jgi:hypothetical protein
VLQLLQRAKEAAFTFVDLVLESSNFAFAWSTRPGLGAAPSFFTASPPRACRHPDEAPMGPSRKLSSTFSVALVNELLSVLKRHARLCAFCSS